MPVLVGDIGDFSVSKALSRAVRIIEDAGTQAPGRCNQVPVGDNSDARLGGVWLPVRGQGDARG
jgi:hypothetical protein